MKEKKLLIPMALAALLALAAMPLTAQDPDYAIDFDDQPVGPVARDATLAVTDYPDNQLTWFRGGEPAEMLAEIVAGGPTGSTNALRCYTDGIITETGFLQWRLRPKGNDVTSDWSDKVAFTFDAKTNDLAKFNTFAITMRSLPGGSSVFSAKIDLDPPLSLEWQSYEFLFSDLGDEAQGASSGWDVSAFEEVFFDASSGSLSGDLEIDIEIDNVQATSVVNEVDDWNVY